MAKILHLASILALTLPSTGCLTILGGGGNKIDIETTPPGATVTLEGFGECETPCAIQLEQTRRVTVAKAGYKPVRLRVPPDSRDISIILELAAPTDEIDATTLPDLD